MTIFGIAGSMGLMLVGFGLYDSIMDIAILQYDQIQHYDAMVINDEDATDSQEKDLLKFLDGNSEIDHYTRVQLTKMTAPKEKVSVSAYVYVPENLENFKKDVTLRDRKSHEQYELTDDGAVICEKTASLIGVKAGDEIRYGTVRLKVLWPESTASGKEVNEDAMVLEMISKDFKGLFTGDIGMVTEEKLILNGCLEDVDFLKTAHHGSRYSTGAEFLEIVRPELAVVSCSASNTYGHPSPDTLERLKKSGSRVLITRDCGAVTIVNGKSVSAFNRIK